MSMAHIRDHYLVLGVSRGETVAGIRAGFRAMAQRLEPAHLSEVGERSWDELIQAYEVLSDPQRRRAHNHELSAQEARSQVMNREPTASGASGSIAHPSAVREPLIPPKFSLLDQPDSVHPSYGALRDRFERNFTRVGVSKAERPEPLTLDVALPAEEAVQGVMLRIGVPVWAEDEPGFVVRERTLSLRIPPMVRAGTVFDVPLDRFGIHNLYLHIRVSLTGDLPPARA